AVDPDYIRVRTLTIKEGMPLYEKLLSGEFEKASDAEVVREEELLIENLKVTSGFVSDHSTNVLMDVRGNLPEDKEHMLSIIRKYLELSEEEQLNFRLGTLFRAVGYAPNYPAFNEFFNPSRRQRMTAVIEDMEAKKPGSTRKLVERLNTMLI
ncbi:MAG: hypothetical protein ACETWR_06065, partial [Anaerolineae bacterium]